MTPTRVLIAGAGIAGLEALAAVRELAGDRAQLTLLSDREDFTLRALSVREPFGGLGSPTWPIAPFAREHGATLVSGRLGWVDAAQRVAHTEAGEAIEYDALLLAVGARLRTRFEHALTVDDRRMDALLHGLVQDIEGGYTRRVAFVAPSRMPWQLPLYELALMTSHRAYDMGVEVEIALVTPEDTPLAIYGIAASEAVAERLQDAAVCFHGATHAEAPEAGRIRLQPGGRELEVDRIVALPELIGPGVRGLPLAEHGFIPVDLHRAVRGAPGAYAAGDATDFAVKHGGLAAQAAEVAAHSIAAAAGAPVEPIPFHPVVRAMLMTGAHPLYLEARITGGAGFASRVSEEPLWTPRGKVDAPRLAAYLARRDVASRAPAGAPAS
jgi:sulfide:quinone oxidoreductase